MGPLCTGSWLRGQRERPLGKVLLGRVHAVDEGVLWVWVKALREALQSSSCLSMPENQVKWTNDVENFKVQVCLNLRRKSLTLS